MLQVELMEVREREAALHVCQGALQTHLERVQGELAQAKEEMEKERLQLSKAAALNQTLQRKHQVRV